MLLAIVILPLTMHPFQDGAMGCIREGRNWSYDLSFIGCSYGCSTAHCRAGNATLEERHDPLYAHEKDNLTENRSLRTARSVRELVAISILRPSCYERRSRCSGRFEKKRRKVERKRFSLGTTLSVVSSSRNDDRERESGIVWKGP